MLFKRTSAFFSSVNPIISNVNANPLIGNKKYRVENINNTQCCQ